MKSEHSVCFCTFDQFWSLNLKEGGSCRRIRDCGKGEGGWGWGGSGFAFLKDYNYVLLTELDVVHVMCYAFSSIIVFLINI